MEEFIGIVRGRTVNSSRGRAQTPQAAQPKQKPQSKPPQRQQQKRAAPGNARKKPPAGGKPGRRR